MTAASVARARGRSVSIARPLLQLLDDVGQDCHCPVPKGKSSGVCGVEAMRVTPADYASGRKLL